MRRVLIWTAVALTVVVAVIAVVLIVSPRAREVSSGLQGKDVAVNDEAAGDSAPIDTADRSGSGPGSLVSAMTMPSLQRTRAASGMRAARVVYRSTNGDTGQPTVVSGAVFVPVGSAPDGGWPVVAMGHGSTGINEPCAPSLSATLLGLSPLVEGFTSQGFAVAVADFQGLGSEGVHPYTDAKTAGLNMIDSVRASRHTFEDISDRWAAIGGSQGGGAAWAADEQAATYAPDLDLVGAVALAPAADVAGLVQKAAAGTLTSEQAQALVTIIESLARLHPDLPRDDYRTGAAAEYWDVLTSCSGSEVHARRAAVAALGPNDLAPRTPQAAERLQRLLDQWALPQQPLTAPLSVAYGGKDNYIDAAWTTEAIAEACALGGTVDWELQPDKGHSDVNIKAQLPWIEDRFKGKPVTNDCA